MSPGSTNSDAIENPSDRTFGGMASDSEAKMPGASSAARPVIRTLAMIATASTGASANATHAPAMPTATSDSRRSPSPGSRSISREAKRDADEDADDLGGLGDAGDEASLRLGEVEDLLVVERRERGQADHRRGEERQRVPDPPQRADLPEDADGLGPRRWFLVGADDLLGGAGRPPLVVPSARLLQPQAEHHEDDRRDHEHEEGHAPAEGLGEDPADDRADERTERVGHPVEAEHVGADLGRVVVGQQRVVGRRDHGAAHARAGPGDHEHEDRRREPGEQAEHRPHRRAEHRDPRPVEPVGVVGEGDLEEEPAEQRERDRG